MRRSLQHVVLGLAPFCASAQDFAGDLLPEIDVVGRKVEPSRLAAPGAGEALVIGPEKLRASAQPSLADLLRREGGVNFTSFLGTPATGTPQLRGFGEGASSRVLILVDGLPMNRPDLASPVWFEFPLAGLERVELQRGGRTVRYGSSALAGVISLETRRAVTEPEWHLQGSAGSWDTSLFRLHGLQPVGNGWTAGASLDWFESGGWRENSAVDSQAFSVSLASPEAHPWRWQGTVSGTWTELENPGGLTTAAYRENPRQSFFTRFGVGDQYRNRLATLRATQQVRYLPYEGQLWQLNASWADRRRELNLGAGSHTDHDLGSLAFDLTHEWQHGGWSGSWGVRGRSDSLYLERFRDQERRESFATADLGRDLLGAFARTAWKVAGPWTLAGGLSWDAYDLDATVMDQAAPGNPLANFTGGTGDGSWGAELSLEYQPDDARRAWLRLDRVFRFPLLDEVAGYQGFLLDTPLNTDLKPETGYGLELGAAFSGKRLTASVAAFAQLLDDEILFDFNQNRNTNFARSRRLGLESRLTWEDDTWQGTVNHQWVSAHFAGGRFDGHRIPLVPGHQLTVSLAWKFAERFELGVEWEWLDDAFEGGDFENTRSRLPGRSLVHLEGRLALGSDWQAYGRVDNLFDESWASLKYLGQWYPGNGRGLTFGLRGSF